MKGMLIKDFCILKLQKNSLLILLAMCIAFTVFMKSPTYITSLFPVYGCLVVLGTLTYDEFDRGYSFLFTLPVSKQGYVREKYVLGLLFCGTIWIVSVLISFICVLIMGEMPVDGSLIAAYVGPIVLVLLFLGISIPVQLKYGNEKGRLAVVGVGLGVFVLVAAAGQFAKFFDIDVTVFLEKIEGLGVAAVSAAGCIVSVILIVISYKISVRIMEKKEF